MDICVFPRGDRPFSVRNGLRPAGRVALTCRGRALTDHQRTAVRIAYRLARRRGLDRWLARDLAIGTMVTTHGCDAEVVVR